MFALNTTLIHVKSLG